MEILKVPFEGEEMYSRIYSGFGTPKTLSDVSHPLSFDTFSFEHCQCHTG